MKGIYELLGQVLTSSGRHIEDLTRFTFPFLRSQIGLVSSPVATAGARNGELSKGPPPAYRFLRLIPPLSYRRVAFEYSLRYCYTHIISCGVRATWSQRAGTNIQREAAGQFRPNWVRFPPIDIAQRPPDQKAGQPLFNI
jgi:hypothetical protein